MEAALDIIAFALIFLGIFLAHRRFLSRAIFLLGGLCAVSVPVLFWLEGVPVSWKFWLVTGLVVVLSFYAALTQRPAQTEFDHKDGW